MQYLVLLLDSQNHVVDYSYMKFDAVPTELLFKNIHPCTVVKSVGTTLAVVKKP